MFALGQNDSAVDLFKLLVLDVYTSQLYETADTNTYIQYSQYLFIETILSQLKSRLGWYLLNATVFVRFKGKLSKYESDKKWR